MLDSLCLPRDLQRTVTGTIPCVTPVNPASDSPCAPPDASPMITKHQKGPLPPAGSATPRLASQPPDPPNISREEKVRQRWKSFQGRRGAEDLTATWEFVSRMLLRNAPMGWEAADRLMRMVFDIGSPATLVDVKEQLRQLRIKATTRPDWEARGTAGVFAAGCWHTTNEHASRVGLRLVYWCIHDHRHRLQQSGHRDPIAQTVNDIFCQLSCVDRDRRLVEGKVKEWNKRAWPWNQLVHIAETPNIICFLPQGGIGYFSGEEGSCMTDYCKLTKAHFDAMDVIFKRHRSRFLDSVPPDFFEIFLYNRPPPHRFAIEDWADYEIFHEPLDSARFDRAFEPVQP
ncbi:uncharacterized protein BJX67DRAFT_40918 [Aspergillus lucknowensis]|uniref:SRR1-like domain-containing protein n=1 Tax=Aspergillus lucknowensis TaxID=176173 RepID=A0ABR4L6L2_9EURO